MNHPEIFVVPTLMLADYALTILGAASSAKVYRKHFVIPTYELNPIWRKNVDRIQWINGRHLALVAIVTCGLILLDRSVTAGNESLQMAFEFGLPILFGGFGCVCGRHLANLLTFTYLNRHPDEISGEVRLSTKLMLKMSQFSQIGLIPIFAIIVVLVPNRTTIGLFLGLLTVIMAHFVWALRADRGDAHCDETMSEKLIDSDA